MARMAEIKKEKKNKLQIFGLGYFLGTSYFGDDSRMQNQLVFQTVSKYFKTPAISYTVNV